MIKVGSLVFSILVAVALAGCDLLDLISDQQIDNEVPIENVVPRPLGTYRQDVANAGDFTLLTLKDDQTFHRETMIYCFAAPCEPLQENGIYEFTKGGYSSYIRFYASDGTLIDRYAYQLYPSQGGTLNLRKAGNVGKWFTLTYSSEAWCGIPADCELQGMYPLVLCLGYWICSDNVCQFKCGELNLCEQAGGECVALTPDSCKDGVIGDYSKYPCGPRDLLGIECCLPNPCPQGVAVGTGTYCLYTGDFPNTCLTLPWLCNPVNSHEVKICNCPTDMCFNGSQCVPYIVY
jgi:hypothetical protein